MGPHPHPNERISSDEVDMDMDLDTATQITAGASDAQIFAVILASYLFSFFAYAWLHSNQPASFRNVTFYQRTQALVTLGWGWRLVFTILAAVSFILWTM